MVAAVHWKPGMAGLSPSLSTLAVPATDGRRPRVVTGRRGGIIACRLGAPEYAVKFRGRRVVIVNCSESVTFPTR